MVDIWKSISWNVALSLIVEGTTETVFQIFSTNKVKLQQNYCFREQKCVFWTQKKD